MPRVPPTPIGKDFNPGGAFWCTEHNAFSQGGRLECTKTKKRTGVRCHAPAVRGTDACRVHAGIKAEIAEARGEAKITAWKHFGDVAKAVEPGVAVLGVLQMSWLRLGAYSQLLKEQVEQDRAQITTGAGPAGPVIDEDGSPVESPVLAGGLIGYRFGAAGKDGHIFAQSEEVRALVTLEAAERDRVVKYAEVAHKMGISSRMLDLAERWGDIVATRVTLIIDGLNLTPAQAALVPGLVTEHLSSLEVDQVGDQEK